MQGTFKKPNNRGGSGASSDGEAANNFSGGQNQLCRSCGKFYMGPYDRILGMCDRCKQSGHIEKNCPNTDMQGKCFTYSGTGHIARNCMNRWLVGFSSPMPSAATQRSVPQPPKAKGDQREG